MFLIVIVSVFGLCQGIDIVMEEFLIDTPYTNTVCSNTFTVFDVSQVSLITCTVLCNSDVNCFGFAYRQSDEQCTGCNFGTMVSSPGRNFFVPQRREWGHPCGGTFACIGANQQCMTVCVCVPGYSFDYTTRSCVNGCATYGSTFQLYPSRKMNDHNIQTHRDVSLSSCLQTCRGITQCISFEYIPSLQQCTLQSVTPLDHPNDYVSANGIDIYVRNC